jgi:hypothetical protein
MPALMLRPAWPALLCAGALQFLSTAAPAQPLLPLDVGTTVNGYQDDFDGTSLAPSWLVLGANVYSVSSGALHVTSASGDPNHLLYAVGGYNNSVQEVLARIRVLNFGTADPPRGGLATCVDPAASPAGGIDLHFRDENLGRHIEFLDDARAWGTEYQFLWQNNTWYWLRLRHEPNAASQGGVNDVFGKIWLADGTQAEPAAWQDVYDYIPGRTARTGYAGLVAGSLGGASDFEVDYVLIKASGLPGIVVAPNTFVQTPVTITNQPQSQTVLQCRPAAFSVGYSGTPPLTFQWYRDGLPIPDATNSSHTLANAQLADDGAAFRVVVSNVASNTPYSATSSDATLTVSADTAPPLLLGAANSGLNEILVTFSEPVTASTANERSNYSISNASGPLPILSATLAPNQTNVTLITTGQVEGVVCTLTVNHITDQCTGGNVMAPDSQVTFVALAYTPADIGSPAPAGHTVSVPGGYDVMGGGTDIGGTNDQFQFSYQARSGDFDLRVRLEALGLSDVWAEAGLMARESLAAGSRFASVMATPTLSGSYFQWRSATNGPTSLRGSLPVNYPGTWLRLQRSGDQFTGYGSFDGQSWTLLGVASLALPANLYFGFAVSSHNTNQTTTAAFRDLSTVTSPATNASAPAIEPLGQSSRKTSLVISEIMYHPGNTRGTMNTNADGYVTNSLEFVELFNALGTPEDLSGFRFSGSIDYTFPANTVMPGGGFLVVARSSADVQSVYGLSGVLGPFTNNLPNDAGTIRLRNRVGAIYLEVNYDSQPPWPAAADGAGHSLILARPSFGEDDPRAWGPSDAVGGSPGRLDPVPLDPLRRVVINEFLAHTDEPELDFVELYNHGAQPLDISGCFLSDDPDTNKFIIPPMTVLPPRGFAVFYETNLNFALGAEGETIYFRNAAKTRVLDAVRFEAQAAGVSFGRSPDGAPTLRALAGKTPGTNNTAFRSSDIVIHEIMYHPVSGHDDDQFVELYNPGTNAVNLGGWRFTAGINFTFPSNTWIQPDGYLVVARNAGRLMTNYPNLGASNVVGDFNGQLAHGGERLALAMPDLIVSTNSPGVPVSNLVYIVVNEVTYRDGGRWGQWSDGGGSSLELRDPRSDNSLAVNWADSDETAKAPWTLVSTTGTLDNGNVTADQLQVLLQGAGECLIDEVEVLNASGANLIANSTFETGASGWTAEGTEQNSGLEPSGGYNSAQSYHVRAVERGDNQVNRIRTPLTASLASGTTATIRAKVRWLRGHPEILFRLRGNWLEAIGSMTLPTNLGTPGAPNSRAIAHAPPAIAEVAHQPILPAAKQACLVTARVGDPGGAFSVVLRYRLDPSASYASATMLDDGGGGDAVAGDGLYSATIPGQAAGMMVAFYVQANGGSGASSTFPSDAPTRECLVRFGELQPAGNFPVYRVWMTQATLNTWNGRSKLDNTPLAVTFVLGNQRVIYHAKGVYAGSPYIAPGYGGATVGRCAYTVTFPEDDLFLGSTDLVLDWPGGHGNENTAMQEQMGYWIAERLNLPTCHRYLIRLHVNGVTDDQRNAVFEANNQPAGEFIDAWSPDDRDGDFYKIDRAFEFNDAGGLVADPQPRLELYTTTGGVKKEARYRWSWIKRATRSANNHTNIFLLADALNAASPEPYTAQTEALVDTEEWMRIFAAEHIMVNFDAYGHEIGKNMYAYKPERGKWQLYMFDLDWLMLAAPAHNASYAASTAPLFNSEDPTITRMYNHPPFRRAYFRAVQDAVDGPLTSGNCDPVLDAKYRSLVANGVQFCDGQALAAPTAVKTWFSQRRTGLLAQLATVASPFTLSGTNNFAVSSNLVTLRGTAPIAVKRIEINGVPWPVTWTSLSNWTLRLAVTAPSNELNLVAYDLQDNPLTNFSRTVTVIYSGGFPEPAGNVVISEVMYQPPVSNASYVELQNMRTDYAFDLSGWRFQGLDYTFPFGSLLPPRSFLVLAKDRAAFATAYGSSANVFAEFDGRLDPDGETLTLFKPGATPAEDLVVDQLRYEPGVPWPSAANGQGAALQSIDGTVDNARVSNWSDGSGWRYFALTGTVQTNGTNFLIWMQLAGDVYIDDIRLVPGSAPGVGANLLQNGDFESPFGTAWSFLGTNLTNSAISTDLAHSGNASLHIVSTGAGSTAKTIVQYLPPQPTNLVHTLSFWYYANPNAPSLVVRTYPGSALNANVNVRPVVFTPGASNSVTASLPPYPEVWLNEVQAENVSGLTDRFGDHDAWVELYNRGTNVIDLGGFYLANQYTVLTQWQFPVGAAIQPGQFLIVWADGEPGESDASEWHTSFALSHATGAVVLTRLLDGQPQILDYLNYAGVPANGSYGSVPDGQPFYRKEMFYPTPGSANNAASPPGVVYINEWMAANTSASGIADPADGNYDDWFELYNPGSAPVDLGGYSLTDTLTNRLQYRIPNNGQYVISPGGFLLVWADNETGQNRSNRADLHVNFQLNRSGEAIGLFAPDGTPVDSVTFGPQTNDVSQGRFPDGVGPVDFMTTPTPRAPNILRQPPRPSELSQVMIMGPGEFVFTFSTVVGQRYQVEYTDDLTMPQWTPLGSLQNGTGEPILVADEITPNSQRFYRVVAMP